MGRGEYNAYQALRDQRKVTPIRRRKVDWSEIILCCLAVWGTLALLGTILYAVSKAM